MEKRVTKKDRDKVKDMLRWESIDGGISDYSEYNQFLCDVIFTLIDHLNGDGVRFLKSEIDNILSSVTEDRHG